MDKNISAVSEMLDEKLNFKNENVKYAVFLFLSILVFIVTLLLLVKPLQTANLEKEQQLVERQQRLAACQTFAAQHSDYDAYELEQKRRMEQSQTELPDYIEVPQVLRQCNHIAERTGTEIMSVKTPAVNTIKQQNGVYTVPFSVVLKGGYYNTVDFLQSIENGERYASLQQVKVDGDEATGEVNVTAQLNMYCVKGVRGASSLPASGNGDEKTGLERVRERDRENMKAVESVR